MSNESNQNNSTGPSYVNRVFTSDIVKKGVAGAAAALLVSAITEAIWPSTES